jgi:4-diphosphocytidyl-2-C-methyl-D-erythritol kinase
MSGGCDGNAVNSIGVREGVGTPGTAGQGPTQRDGEAVARVRPVAARLGKRIPLGAGLGGGSSDAARTLIGLNRFWNANWSADELAPLAAQLGSDVPFFLHGPSSICTGRGEVVKPVSPPTPKWAVLVLPDIHMPTAAVYRRFDEMNFGFDEFIEEQPNWEHWSTRKAKDFMAGVVNDLETPAFQIRPDLGTLRSDIELKLVRPVRMSGSGSSLFTLFDDEREARAAAGNISEKFDNVRVMAVETAPMLNDDAA